MFGRHFLIIGFIGLLSPIDAVNIVAVVDESLVSQVSMLEYAVDYVNQGSSNIIPDQQVSLSVIQTTMNDSLTVVDKVCQQLQTNGIDVILDLSSHAVSAAIKSYADTMGIPHVASVDPSFYEHDLMHSNATVNVIPLQNTMMQAVRVMAMHENLTNLAVVYDDTFNFDDKPKRFLRNLPVQHMYQRMVMSDDDMEKQLDLFKHLDLTHILLAGSTTNAAKYLAMANTKGMVTFKYNWYVLTKDVQLSCSGCITSSAVLIVGKPDTALRNDYVQFLKTKIADYSDSSVQMSHAFHFDLVLLVSRTLNAILAGSSWTTASANQCPSLTPSAGALAQAKLFQQQIKQVPHTGVFGSLTWTDHSAEQDIALDFHRYQFENGAVTTQTAVGSWSKQAGLNAFSGTIANVNVKRYYRITTVADPPFIFKSTSPPPPEKNVKYTYYNSTSKEYYFGYCIDLIYKINETMEFEFDIFEPADGAYGSMKEDGSWDGMVNDLIQDRADIIVAPLSVMAERENVIDFTVPYYDLVGITILMKKPPLDQGLFKFMYVLEDPVWGCVGGAFVIVSILLALFDKYSPFSYQNNKHIWDGKGDEPRVFSLKESLWFCMTSLTPQGGGEAPRALSGRLIAATWWVFGFIMIATYTANLAAFLTVSRLDQPIESLDDLANQFKTKYAPQASTSTETYFRRMADIEDRFYSIWKDMSLNDSMDAVERAKLAVWDYPVSDKFTNMWSAMTATGFPKTFADAIERMKNPPEGEEFAFIGDATQNKFAYYTDCDLWEVGEEFSRKPYALAVQEGSPLKNELSSKVLQLLNQRVLEDLKTTWWDYERVKCQSVEDDSQGITIQSIGGVFLVIFIGIGIGMITLGLEYYWYKWRPQGSDKENSQTDEKDAGKDDMKFRPPVGHEENGDGTPTGFEKPPPPGYENNAYN